MSAVQQSQLTAKNISMQEAAKNIKKSDKFYYFHKIKPSESDGWLSYITKLVFIWLTTPLALIMDCIRNLKNYIWPEVEQINPQEDPQEAAQLEVEQEQKISKTRKFLNYFNSRYTYIALGLITVIATTIIGVKIYDAITRNQPPPRDDMQDQDSKANISTESKVEEKKSLNLEDLPPSAASKKEPPAAPTKKKGWF